MQYKDKLYGYLFVLVIVTFAVGALYFLTKSSPIEGSSLIEANSLINALEIKYGDSSLILEKNVHWKVNSLPANEFLINELVNKLIDAKVVEVASTNPDNFSLFDINNGSPVFKIKFSNENTVELRLGKKSFDKSYVQKDNEPKVYYINESITDYGFLGAESFLEKKPFNFSKAEISEIVINKEVVSLDESAITQFGSFSSSNIFLNKTIPESESDFLVSIKVATETFSYKFTSLDSKFFVINLNSNIVYEITEEIFKIFEPKNL